MELLDSAWSALRPGRFRRCFAEEEDADDEGTD